MIEPQIFKKAYIMTTPEHTPAPILINAGDTNDWTKVLSAAKTMCAGLEAPVEVRFQTTTIVQDKKFATGIRHDAHTVTHRIIWRKDLGIADVQQITVVSN
jgi:hypothetical protein